MLVYKSIDGQIHEGRTAVAVVAAMRNTSFDGRTMSVAQYMERVAATAQLWSKLPVRTDTAANFLADLEQTKIIWRVQ